MTDKTSNKKKAAIGAAGVVALVAAGFGGAGLNALFTDTQAIDSGEFYSGTVLLGKDFKDGVTSLDYSQKVENLAAGDTTYRIAKVKNVGSLDFGRVEVKLKTEGALADAGKALDAGDTRTATTVTGADAVGAGNTPLHIGIEGCAGKWNVSGISATPAVKPTCSGTSFVVKDTRKNGTDTTTTQDAFKESLDGLQDLAKANAFKDAGQNAILFDIRKQGETDSTEADTITDFGTEAANNFKAGGDGVEYLMTYHLPNSAKNEYQETGAKMNFTFTATQRDSQTFEATAPATPAVTPRG